MKGSKYLFCVLFLLQFQTIFSATFCADDSECSGLANNNPCKAWRCTGLCTSNYCLLKRSSVNETEIDEGNEEAKRAQCPCCRLDNLATGSQKLFFFVNKKKEQVVTMEYFVMESQLAMREFVDPPFLHALQVKHANNATKQLKVAQLQQVNQKKKINNFS
jgi:hypothetical protein